MNELALFAGAGGGILGGQLLGWETVCAVEVDTFCSRRLMQRQNEGHLPPFPIWDDVYTFDGHPWKGAVDVVSGGFPCQAFSGAARGRNNKPNLWPEMLRIIGEVQPGEVFAENVSEEAIIQAQADLEDCGYVTSRVAIGAKDVGGDHIRGRFWLRGHADNKRESGMPEHAEAPGMPELCCDVWGDDPRSIRVSDGVADRVDRLKSVGNGQVPEAAALAWKVLARG